LVGVITGTYSSIFIASAFVVEWRDAAEKRRIAKGGRPSSAPPQVVPSRT
jgi:preprotein translocase subunit SecF